MSSVALGEGAQRLLETRLDSFEKLEIAQLLWRSEDGLSQQEIEAACQFSSDIIADALAALERASLIERSSGAGRIRLGAASLDPAFAPLMQLYNEDRASVLSILSSTVMQRLRTMAARAFADAFVIRKKRGDDG